VADSSPLNLDLRHDAVDSSRVLGRLQGSHGRARDVEPYVLYSVSTGAESVELEVAAVSHWDHSLEITTETSGSLLLAEARRLLIDLRGVRASQR